MRLSTLPTIRLTKAQQSLIGSERRIASALNSLLKTAQNEFDLVWRNKDSTPAEMLAAMSTGAVAAFAAHARTVAFLQAQGVDYEYSKFVPPLSYTEHPDGTITLN